MNTSDILSAVEDFNNNNPYHCTVLLPEAIIMLECVPIVITHNKISNNNNESENNDSRTEDNDNTNNNNNNNNEQPVESPRYHSVNFTDGSVYFPDNRQRMFGRPRATIESITTETETSKKKSDGHTWALFIISELARIMTGNDNDTDNDTDNDNSNDEYDDNNTDYNNCSSGFPSRQHSTEEASQLAHDIKACRRQNIMVECESFWHSTIVTLLLPMTENNFTNGLPIVEPIIADCWGLSLEAPLVVTIKFYTEYIRYKEPPIVEVAQNDTKFHFGQQLRTMVRLYLLRRWNRTGFNPNHRPDVVNENEYNIDNDETVNVPYNTEDGFLLHLVKYIYNRIPTAHKHCVVCDMTHIYGYRLPRPVVCCRELCTFRFRELKIGSDATDRIEIHPAVVILLQFLFWSATTRPDRFHYTVRPFPEVADPSCPDKLLFTSKAPNYNLLANTVKELIPDVNHYVSELFTKGSLSQSIPLGNPVLNALSSWVIASNGSYIVALEDEIRLSAFPNAAQFLLIQSTPEKEKEFIELKSQHGTTFAWHGSEECNWHSILRNGLEVMTGKGVVHGSAHGTGIYVAPNIDSSLGYAKGSFVRAVALCEIINHSYNDHGWCWVIPKNESIMTRMLLVFPNDSRISNVAASSIVPEVKNVMKRFNIAL